MSGTMEVNSFVHDVCVTTSLGPSQLTTGATIIQNKPRHLPNFIEKT